MVSTLHESVTEIDKEFRDLTLKYSDGTALALLKLAIMSRETDIKEKAAEVYESDKS